MVFVVVCIALVLGHLILFVRPWRFHLFLTKFTACGDEKINYRDDEKAFVTVTPAAVISLALIAQHMFLT